jgi:6-phosphogluconolactonase
MTGNLALYSAVGDELTHYSVDVAAATLTRRASVHVPAVVQYAWPHPSKRFLYVATSNRGAGMKADRNHVSAYRIDPATGALAPHGEPQPLYARAVHCCVDPSGGFLVSAHNLPRTGITVNRLNADGTIGATVPQPAGLDYGLYPHQVMVSPSGRTVILVDRGNDAAGGKPEDPGALRLFRFDAGKLAPLSVIAPGGGYGYGPRHLDFHPQKPWVYASMERQNRLLAYRMAGDGIETDAAYARDTLAEPRNERPRQLAGPIHVHPGGRYVYLANRADWEIEETGARVFGGGENNIAAFGIDGGSGEPSLLQHAATRCGHVRTFAFDPSGQLMVAASIKPLAVREGGKTITVPAALAVFRVGDDGKLDFARKYDIDTGGRIHYWMGIVSW